MYIVQCVRTDLFLRAPIVEHIIHNEGPNTEP